MYVLRWMEKQGPQGFRRLIISLECSQEKNSLAESPTSMTKGQVF